MKILHVVPGLDEPTNGIAVAAKWIAESHRKAGHEVEIVETRSFLTSGSVVCDEAWVHSMWLPATLRACRMALKANVKLVRMPHGCLDPVKIRYHHWKKSLATPFERWLMRRAERVVATEDAEADWIRAFVAPCRPQIQMLDLGSTVAYSPRPGLGKGRFVYVGRLHPLKGVDALIAAVRELRDERRLSDGFSLTVIGRDDSGLRSEFETRARGLPIRFLGEVDAAVKRREMAAADRFVLPTLSENFALVVKESLELGVPAIVTDGAQIWKGHDGVTYLDGFVAASPARRVAMLKDAMAKAMA